MNTNFVSLTCFFDGGFVIKGWTCSRVVSEAVPLGRRLSICMAKCEHNENPSNSSRKLTEIMIDVIEYCNRIFRCYLTAVLNIMLKGRAAKKWGAWFFQFLDLIQGMSKSSYTWGDVRVTIFPCYPGVTTFLRNETQGGLDFFTALTQFNGNTWPVLINCAARLTRAGVNKFKHPNPSSSPLTRLFSRKNQHKILTWVKIGTRHYQMNALY